MQPSLEELLVKTKLISPPQLAVAQRDAEMRQTPLAHALIDLGFISDRKFAEWISGVTSLPIVDPLRPDVISDIEGHLPPELARERQVVPIDVDADEMTIATVDPLDRQSIAAIHDATGMKIHPVIGVRSQIAQMVERFYPEPQTFDPSATVAAPFEPEPFAFGDETLLRHHSLEFAYGSGDASLGSETRVLPMPAAVPPEETTNPTLQPTARATAPAAPETQLDRIERHLSDLVRVIDGLQRRVDAIDATLARVLNRD
jgi:Type II secretion system (T2SS), protein E, N-terminal domain